MTAANNELVTNNEPLAARIERYRNSISNEEFGVFYHRYNNTRNLDEGYGQSRNNPTSSADDNRHSPSSLFQCHRKIYYRMKNAPREYPLPNGTFLMGHLIEEDVVEPWLKEYVCTDDEYIDNAGHVNFTEDADGVELAIGGSHDPKICDVRGQTFAVTEVKSTGSDPHWLDKVKIQHKAQAHAYMKGLLEKEEALSDYPPAFVIYVQKESLDIFPFLVEFDEDFWEEVLDWAKQNTGYRANDILPEPTPILGQDEDNSKQTTFECDYCNFRNRCGNYDIHKKQHKWDDTLPSAGRGVVGETYADQDYKGFLPLKIYPLSAVYDHIMAHPDVKLTPTLAASYPEFVENPSPALKNRIAERGVENNLLRKYGSIPTREVHDWQCHNCENTFNFETFDWWDGDVNNTPYCDHCKSSGDGHQPVRGPLPDEQ